MKKIILASASPRRKELLELLDLNFDIKVADIDETININNDLNKEIERLAYQKADAIFKDHNDAIVIGADTIVVYENKILLKPHTDDKAFEMLKLIQGKTHKVITGVAILSDRYKDNFSVISEVTFNKMDEEEILEYIASKEPLDKAGAYAIQGIGSKYISKINGDYYAIMGLPISEIYRKIKKYLQK